MSSASASPHNSPRPSPSSLVLRSEFLKMMATSTSTPGAYPAQLPALPPPLSLPSPPYPDSQPQSQSQSQSPSPLPSQPQYYQSPSRNKSHQSQSPSQSQSQSRSRSQSTQSPPRPRPQPQPQQQPQPQTQTQPQPKPQFERQPSAQARTEPRPEPRGEPRPQPRSEPRSEPWLEPEEEPQPQPQPRSRSQPQSQSRAQSKPKKPRVDGKTYYGYLYNKDKSPTDTFIAVLRSVGQYIIDNVGDRKDKELSPNKLAAFYRAVGGDYDSLFVHAPNKSISYVWRALGVQHTLQPTDNDFEEPSVPAMTLRGFVRWQSLQILLEPEEHVPYIQYALANWGLKHPDTGEPFPVDLPAEALPTECDAEIDAWHKTCAEKLRQEAAAREESPPPPPPREPSPEPRRYTAYAQPREPPPREPPAREPPAREPPAREPPAREPPAREPPAREPQARGPPPSRQRPNPAYFTGQRPVSYIHVTEARYAPPRPAPNPPADKRHVDNSSGSSSDEDVPRRRSYPDMRSHPRAENVRPSGHSDPHQQETPRRHNNQRSYSPSSSESETDSDASPHRSSKSSRPYSHISPPPPPPPSIRRVPPGSHTPPSAVPLRPRREIRTDEPHRMSFPAEIKQRLTSMFPGTSDRRRSTSREKNRAPIIPPGVRFTPAAVPTRLSRSVSGDSYPSDDSDLDIAQRYASRRQREHARALGKERERELELEEERERRSRKERAYLRPTIHRRTSSHADAERQMRENMWIPRDRERSREWERDREGRRMMTSADEREARRAMNSTEDRERRRYKDRELATLMTGVSGRRYPRKGGIF